MLPSVGGFAVSSDGYFSYFSLKPYVVTPHLNHYMTPHLNGLIETVQMRGHNIWFHAELIKMIPGYHQIPPPYLELCCLVYNGSHDMMVLYQKIVLLGATLQMRDCCLCSTLKCLFSE